MPVPLIAQVYYDGITSVPYLLPIIKALPWITLLVILKFFFNGTQNGNERIMHSRVAIVTGGTSGIGAAVVNELAARGTQLILLVRDPSDIFTVDYITDLRARHNNDLIFAEKCDLSSLHSVRLFATKFIDNSPPRRLDMVICCAGVMAPPGVEKRLVGDTREDASGKGGVEEQWAVNYLGHVHLLELLMPLLRVQPMDRDVRVLLATCPSYLLGELDVNDLLHSARPYPKWAPWRVYGATKLALMTYAVETQRRFHEYKRPDGGKNQVRVFCVDPGVSRTLGTRRWISMGSIPGLLAYLLTWPLWWLILKSPESGAQSFLTAAMSIECARGEGGVMIKECKKHKYVSFLNTSRILH
ncbi:NAD(P)-binding protein [Ascodesmis nigricans]|uniref:NAD(P)-binding protein n=1 Tax=Ascodesmis nigricans TaxID=341454 RepID=A0A4S2N6E5_9PEZI|nr:NAD(P)-binding protein [Ascodesmis nigricans]